MIQASTYMEAKMEAIHLLSDSNSYVVSIKIIYKDSSYWVIFEEDDNIDDNDNEDFNDDVDETFYDPYSGCDIYDDTTDGNSSWW